MYGSDQPVFNQVALYGLPHRPYKHDLAANTGIGRYDTHPSHMQ